MRIARSASAPDSKIGTFRILMKAEADASSGLPDRRRLALAERIAPSMNDGPSKPD
jgi:hypothetical protein